MAQPDNHLTGHPLSGQISQARRPDKAHKYQSWQSLEPTAVYATIVKAATATMNVPRVMFFEGETEIRSGYPGVPVLGI